MSTSMSVEELVVETLRRAGELAVPGDHHLPFQLDDHERDIDERRLVRGGTRRSWWIAVTSVAALVLGTVGLTVLLHSSPSIPITRTQGSAAQGQRLLCGSPGCSFINNSSAGTQSQSSTVNAEPALGVHQSVPPIAPSGTWVVASNGEFQRVINASTRAVHPVNRPKSGTIFLSAGDARYYRFATPGRGPLRVVGHNSHTVTLEDSDGRSYVLDLPTIELRPRQ